MAKKILIISASPRKGGNSDTLCDQFKKGAEEAGNAVEKIFLREKKIGYCVGCESCQNTGKCVQKDDMSEILDKMIAADIIVLSTPIYFYSMDAQLKTLIDRCVPRYTDIRNKGFFYIMTAADGDEGSFHRTIESIRGFTEDCLPGSTEEGIICATGVWKKGEVLDTPFMKEAYEMGSNA